VLRGREFDGARDGDVPGPDQTRTGNAAGTARATQRGSSWLARCERDLAVPDPDVLPERLPRPTGSLSLEL
jgi:hypothetical protein